MQKLRIFIAIPLPASLLDELSEVQHRLQRRLPHGSVRWVSADGIHLTLKFLGDTPRDEIPKVRDALSVVARNAPAVDLAAGGLGCFPGPGRPRVLWVGVSESTGRLKVLYQAVEEAMTSLGYRPERHSFTPHLTLGRVRRGTSRQDEGRIGEVVTDTSVGELARFTADRFELIRSDLKPTGAEYTTLETFPLMAGES